MIWKLCYLIWQFYDVLTILSHDTHQSCSQHINRLCCSAACRFDHLLWIYFVVWKSVQIEFIVARLCGEPVLFSFIYVFVCECEWSRAKQLNMHIHRCDGVAAARFVRPILIAPTRSFAAIFLSITIQCSLCSINIFLWLLLSHQHQQHLSQVHSKIFNSIYLNLKKSHRHMILRSAAKRQSQSTKFYSDNDLLFLSLFHSIPGFRIS